MTRWSLRTLLWTFSLVPLLAPSAQAASITTYGSIIITALGNDTLKIEYTDKPSQPTTDPVVPVGGVAGGVGGGETVGGGSVAGGEPGSLPPAPPMGSGSGGDSGGGSSVPGTGATGNPSAIGGGSTTSVTDSGGDAVTPTGETDVPPLPIDMPTTSPTDTVPPPPGTTPDVTSGGPVVTSTADTPEPASLTLLAMGGLGSWVIARRRRDSK